jgi:formyltetrahydrofolate hydrolase
MLVLPMDDLKLESWKVKEVAGGIIFIQDITKICHSIQKLLVRGRCTDIYIDIIIVISNLMGKVCEENLSIHVHRNIKQSLFFDSW